MKTNLKMALCLLLAVCSLNMQAQTSSCKAAYDKAMEYFEAGLYAQAKDYFENAKQTKCGSDPHYLKLCEEKIALCKEKIKASAEKKSSPSSVQPAEQSHVTELSSNVRSLSFSAAGGNKEAGIEINDDSVISVDYSPDWIAASVDNKSKLLKISVAANNGAERESLVKLSANGAVLYISISQEAVKAAGQKQDISMNTDLSALHIVSSGGTKTVKVMTNSASWKVISSPDWCKCAAGKNTLTVSCLSNLSNSSREGQIVIQAPGADAIVISVEQGGAPQKKAKPVTWGIKAGMTASTFGASFGEAAGSIFNYGYGEDIEKPSYGMGIGYRAGLFLDVRLARILYLQPGVYFSYQRTTNRFENSYNETFAGTPTIEGLVYDSYVEKYSSSYIEVPVLLSLRFALSRKSTIGISAGPYIAYAIGGKCKLSGSMDAPSLTGSDGGSYNMHADVTGEANLFKAGGSYTESYTTGNADTFDYTFSNTAAPYKRFDAGLSFGITYEFSWISLTVGYDLGLVNYANKDFWETNRLKLSDYNGAVLPDYKQKNQKIQITLGFKFNK